jgi:hypothetical protein
MYPFVAFGRQCDQILFHITTRPAAQFEVMHLQVLQAPRAGIDSLHDAAPGGAVRDSCDSNPLASGRPPDYPENKAFI